MHLASLDFKAKPLEYGLPGNADVKIGNFEHVSPIPLNKYEPVNEHFFDRQD
jgi:hypothetical protein